MILKSHSNVLLLVDLQEKTKEFFFKKVFYSLFPQKCFLSRTARSNFQKSNYLTIFDTKRQHKCESCSFPYFLKNAFRSFSIQFTRLWLNFCKLTFSNYFTIFGSKCTTFSLLGICCATGDLLDPVRKLKSQAVVYFRPFLLSMYEICRFADRDQQFLVSGRHAIKLYRLVDVIRFCHTRSGLPPRTKTIAVYVCLIRFTEIFNCTERL